MKQPLEVREMGFMPQEGESTGLKYKHIPLVPITGLVPEQGTCQCTALALGFINETGKNYKSHLGEKKSRIGSRA